MPPAPAVAAHENLHHSNARHDLDPLLLRVIRRREAIRIELRRVALLAGSQHAERDLLRGRVLEEADAM